MVSHGSDETQSLIGGAMKKTKPPAFRIKNPSVK